MTDFVPPLDLRTLTPEDRIQRLELLVQHLDRELAKLQKFVGSREDWERFASEYPGRYR